MKKQKQSGVPPEDESRSLENRREFLRILSGGAVRYRLYSAWGLSALEIGAIVAFNSMTTFLGLASLIGLASLVAPGARPPSAEWGRTSL